MEERKKKEIEYYDKEAKESSEKEIKEAGSREGFNPFLLESYDFLYNLLKEKCQGKKILDYGCGSGIHLTWLAKIGREVVGIDLSQKSLELAQKRLKKEKLANKVKILLMDCEEMEFPDNSFDIIFDGSTFSSLDFNKALPEIHRVLRPDGFVIGIETFGHNPFANLKRTINKLTGKRTSWAATHIFQLHDFEKVKEYFWKTEAHFFHLVSFAIFPFLNLRGSKFVLRLLEKIDRFLMSVFPFLRKYSFKIVFIFSKPKNK